MNLWKVILATLSIFVTGVVTGGLLVSYTDKAAQREHNRQIRAELPQLAPILAPAPAPVPSEANPREFPPRPIINIPNRAPRALSVEFLQKLNSEVHLTDAQRTKIDLIVTEGQMRNRRIWDIVAPNIRDENIKTQGLIRDVLRPDQQDRFDELMRQSRANARKSEDSPEKRLRDPQRRPARDSNSVPATGTQ